MKAPNLHTWICLLMAAPGIILAAEKPISATFQTNKLAEIDAAIGACIKAGDTPGAVFWLERQGTVYHRAYGHKAIVPAEEPAAEDTLYDAASLTKVIATTPCILLLIQRHKIHLDDPVKSILPEFDGEGRETITIRNLLTHTSGLRPGLSRSPAWSGYARGIELACHEKPQDPPGTVFRYSDINFILLGEVVRRASGLPLNEFAAREIYGPLKMVDTGFLPPAEKRGRIAPTERDGSNILHGVVHDPTARCMGGVAGHAGLFTTTADLARYARLLLGQGSLDGVQVFTPATVQLMTSVQSPPAVPSRRGLGWDIDTGYSRRGAHFPLGSFGHTGWTGTCLWIDPHSETFWILLSNRVHPDGKGNVLALQTKLSTLAAEAVIGFNFAYVPGALLPRPPAEAPKATERPVSSVKPGKMAAVLNGIDVLAKQGFSPLKGKRIGLITNQSGIDRHRQSTIDLLRAAPEVQLKVLFSPEHGIRGDRDEKVNDAVDEKTGLPIVSLYGENRKPKLEQLRDLDALVFDIQDIGCRFYTYISTLGNCLEAAGQAKLQFIVLDRVNPINGWEVDGPVLTGKTSFIAFHTLPVRHGMTVGELARMFNEECNFKASLTVIPLEGWSRDLWFDQTGLPWINPSPNMRSLTEATLYPGVGLLETTALSVGRGTGTPFEVIGAPYVKDVALAAELNQARLPGVAFVPIQYTPNASTYKNQLCGGVGIILANRQQCPVVDIGLLLAKTLHQLYPAQFNLDKFDNLLGHQATIQALKAGKSLAEIRQNWKPNLDQFLQRRSRFLLYQ